MTLSRRSRTVHPIGRSEVAEDLTDLNFTTADTFAEGDLAYINSSGYILRAQANASSSMHAIGVSVGAAASGFQASIRNRGRFTSDNYDFSGFIGRFAYASTATAGAIQTTPPGSSGQIVQVVGHMVARRSLVISLGHAFQRSASGDHVG